MPSKQQRAKDEQGYSKKPAWTVCANCANYTSDFITLRAEWIHEANKRCTLGGFKVSKLATCKRHENVAKERSNDNT